MSPYCSSVVLIYTSYPKRRDILTFNSFWAVVMTFENSWMAGRNFSCISQILVMRQHRSGLGVAHGVQECRICCPIVSYCGIPLLQKSLPIRLLAIVDVSVLLVACMCRVLILDGVRRCKIGCSMLQTWDFGSGLGKWRQLRCFRFETMRLPYLRLRFCVLQPAPPSPTCGRFGNKSDR